MSVSIFISAVSDEFSAYREQLRKDLTRHNVEVKIQEDFVDLGGDTLDKLDQYIAHCDAVVHLVGDMTGSAPGDASQRALIAQHEDLPDVLPPLAAALKRGDTISYTQWEAWLALYHKKLLLIANPHADAPRGPAHAPTDGSRAAQAAHLSSLQVMKRYSACDFTGPDNLAKHVALTAVLDLLAKDKGEATPGRLDAMEQAAERRHREMWEAVSRDKGVDPAVLAPIFVHLGQEGLTSDQMRARADEAVAAILARAAQAVAPSNEGGDIDAVIGAARARLGKLDTDGARKVLDEKIAEEEAARRQRMVPLLAEKAEVARLTYDHEAAKAALTKLLEIDPNQFWSWIDLGKLWMRTGSLRPAADAFRDAKAAADRLAESSPGEAKWQRNFYAAAVWIGDALVAQGDRADALNCYRDALALAERVAEADPANADWQFDVGISNERIGDMLFAQGNLAAALNSYAAKRDIISRLAASDPTNAGWQRDLWVSLNKTGEVLVAQGKRAGALKRYRDGLYIAERLAASDPANVEWQRDLSISFNLIGEVLVAQGEHADALKSFRNSFDIAERLAASDPANAGWQRDLSVSLNLIGEVLVAKGERAGALKSFRNSLAIVERLAASDPANAEWQRDLAVSCVKISEAFPNEAPAMLARAQAIVYRLRDEVRLADVDAWMPDDLARRIAALDAAPPRRGIRERIGAWFGSR